MVTEAEPLRPVAGSGPWRGLMGLTAAETRRWLPWRSLILVAVGLGALALVSAIWWVAGSQVEANFRLGSLLYPFFALWAIALTLVTAAAAQGAVAGEVEEGTAAWLVGMPVARPAFVVSKVLGAVPGVLAAVFGAGLFAYPVFSHASTVQIETFTAMDIVEAASRPIGSEGFTVLPAFSDHLGVLIQISLFLLVLVALMVLLGALFRSESIVLGVGVVIAVGLFAIGFVGVAGLVDSTPAGLIAGVLAAVNAEAEPLGKPVLVSLLWIVGMTGLAVARFQRREL